MKSIYFILFSLFISYITSAQSLGGVEGYVRDATTLAKMPSVEILISPHSKGMLTNSKGHYSIKGLPPGKYILHAKHLGYIPFEKELSIVAGKITTLNIVLPIDIKELLAVEIRDDKINNHAYSKVVMKEAQIEQRPVRDIGDFLREIPNLYAVRKGGANLDPVIRGFKFKQLNVQLDNGLRMEGGCPNRMDPTTSHVEASDIEAIEVLKGPFALRYGPVMGGVINMLTATPRPFDKFQIHLKASIGYESNWNGMRQHYAIYGGGKKVFFTLTANNSKYGNYTDGAGNSIPSSFHKYGYTAKLGIAPTKNQELILTYSAFYARNVQFSALPMDERADNTKLYSLDYSVKIKSKHINSFRFKAYLTDVDHTMDNKQRGFSDTVVSVSHILAQRYGYRAEFDITTGQKSHLFVGTDMYAIAKDGDRNKLMIGQYPMNGKVPVKIENLWNNAGINNYGLFTEYRINRGLWESVAALRLDYNSACSDSISLFNMKKHDILNVAADSTKSQFLNISFSFGITRKITENSSLGVSIGRGVRSPGMLERFIINLPVGFDNYEYIGNPHLKPEANNELDIVFKHTNRNVGGIELTAFYSVVQNYIGGTYLPPAVQKPLTQKVLGVKEFNNLGEANLYGFEFSFATPERYKWRLSYTSAITMGDIKHVEVLKFDANRNVIGKQIINNDPLGEIPPFNMNLNLSYKFFNNKLVPSMNVRYSAAQNRVSKAMQELTTPAFTLLDMSVSYRYNANFRIVGGVNNALNRAYYEHLNRRVLGTDSRIYEPGRVFFTNLIFNF